MENSWYDLLRDTKFMLEYLNGPVYAVSGMYQPLRENIAIKVVGVAEVHTFGVRRHKSVEEIFTKVFKWLPASECSRQPEKQQLPRSKTSSS